MVSITVNLFKPLVGTLVGGVTTGSLWPEEDATTTADEVDASLVEEYAGGLGTKSESGAPYPRDRRVKRSVRHRESGTHVSVLLITGTLGLFVVKDHLIEERIVKLGERTGDAVAILTGVTAGEQVVLNPGQDVRDGVRVQ